MKTMRSVIVFSCCLAVVLAVCPDGFERHGNGCYKVSALEASWIEAKFYCRALGSELLIVNTASEENTIEGMLTRLHGAHIDEEYWISGSDIRTEKDWRWMVKDGQSFPIVYTNWSPGSPSNSGGQENCLSIRYHGAKTAWNDKNCNELHSFICEIGYDGSVGVYVTSGGETIIG